MFLSPSNILLLTLAMRGSRLSGTLNIVKIQSRASRGAGSACLQRFVPYNGIVLQTTGAALITVTPSSTAGRLAWQTRDNISTSCAVDHSSVF